MPQTKMVISQIKSMHSPDTKSLANYVPNESDNFSVLIQMHIGPKNQKGEESFDIEVCTPKRLAERTEQGPLLCRAILMVKGYDYLQIEHFLKKRFENVSGGSWVEVASKLSRYALWEFDDYSK